MNFFLDEFGEEEGSSLFGPFIYHMLLN